MRYLILFLVFPTFQAFCQECLSTSEEIYLDAINEYVCINMDVYDSSYVDGFDQGLIVYFQIDDQNLKKSYFLTTDSIKYTALTLNRNTIEAIMRQKSINNLVVAKINPLNIQSDSLTVCIQIIVGLTKKRQIDWLDLEGPKFNFIYKYQPTQKCWKSIREQES